MLSSVEFESSVVGGLTRLLADSGRVVSKGGKRRVRVWGQDRDWTHNSIKELGFSETGNFRPGYRDNVIPRPISRHKDVETMSN